jgi:hypothetical protein
MLISFDKSPVEGRINLWDAEIAPGVGKGTDMYMIAGLGNSSQVRPEIQEKMEREYQKMKKKHMKLQDDSSRDVSRYVNSLPRPTLLRRPTNLKRSKSLREPQRPSIIRRDENKLYAPPKSKKPEGK